MCKKFLKIYLLFGLTISLLTCSFNNNSPPAQVTKIIEEIETEFCPDKRVAHFEVTAKKNGSKIIILGETLSGAAKSALFSRLTTETDYQVIDSLVVLPHPSLGNDVYGVVRISVSQLRRKPDVYYEIISQGTMGSEVKILKKDNSDWWVYCQLDDGYLGWMMSGALKTGDLNFINNWRNQNKLIVVSNYGEIKAQPTVTCKLNVSDVVRGNILIDRGFANNWHKVELPDGRVGFIPASQVMKVTEYEKLISPPDVPKLVDLACEFIGLPYLWGGRSTKGFDCSGLTQTIYKLNGIQLPRDANMQVKVGTAVSFNDSLENLQPGDLVFFGKNIDKITHVGMYLGKGRFIHSDGLVRINSFNPADENYSEFRRKGLQAVRRIIN